VNGQWKKYSTQQVVDIVNQVSRAMLKYGIKPGDTVAIIANNRPEWAIAAYACFGLGVAFVPMYEAQVAKDWEFIVGLRSKALVVATDAIVEKTKLPRLDPRPAHLDDPRRRLDKVKTFRSCRDQTKVATSSRDEGHVDSSTRAEHGQLKRHLARQHRVERQRHPRVLPVLEDRSPVLLWAHLSADVSCTASSMGATCDCESWTRSDNPRGEAHASSASAHLQQAHGGAEADLDEAQLHPVDGEELPRRGTAHG
jgi:non-ribosomal peptide synthetase component F